MEDGKVIDGTPYVIAIVVVVVLLVGMILFVNQSKCNGPYFEYKKGECCLDADLDDVCDQDVSTHSGRKSVQSDAIDSNRDPLNPMKEKLECPYECCSPGEDYQTKMCELDFSCKSNVCVPNDQDKDGLFDFEEKEIGTNLMSADTDNDLLSDYEEVKLTKSDPLDKNTDDDRYIDGEDKEPLVSNSAIIELSYSAEPNPDNSLALVVSSTLQNVATVASSAGTVGVVVGSVVPGAGNILGGSGGAFVGAAGGILTSWEDIKQYWDDRDKTIIKFTFTNTGDDYTEFAEFDILARGFYRKDTAVLSQGEVKIATIRSGKILPHNSQEFAEILDESELEEFLKAKIVEPSQCDGLFEFCDFDSNLDLSDVRYEKFP